MSTIDRLVRSGALLAFEVPDWEKRSPIRRFLYAPAIEDWLDGEPRTHDGTIEIGGRTPDEHFQLFFSDFCCAERPCVADLKRLDPTSDGLWKAHPPGLRVFGWCAAPGNFVAVSAALEADIKRGHKQHIPAKATDYPTHQALIWQFIRKHDLEQTVILGDALKVWPPKA